MKTLWVIGLVVETTDAGVSIYIWPVLMHCLSELGGVEVQGLGLFGDGFLSSGCA